MKKQSCENCNAFLPENGFQGWCRANPPVPIMIGMSSSKVNLLGFENKNETSAFPLISSYFPQMTNNGWCRKWQEQTIDKKE